MQFVIHAFSRNNIDLVDVVCKLNFKKGLLLGLNNINVSLG
jgi:hypothetical protein